MNKINMRERTCGHLLSVIESIDNFINNQKYLICNVVL